VTDPSGGRRARRQTFAERRERRAAVDDPAVVLDAAARFLETRSRSISEVRRRLATAGYRTELVEGAIARLVELGMLDDAAFARAWVESRDRARPRGERALRQELRLKGIDPAVVDEVLAERDGAGDGGDAGEPATSPDADAADRLLARSARLLARVADPRARRRRAYALLARNGFDPDTVVDALRRYVASTAAAEPELDEDG